MKLNHYFGLVFACDHFAGCGGGGGGSSGAGSVSPATHSPLGLSYPSPQSVRRVLTTRPWRGFVASMLLAAAAVGASAPAQNAKARADVFLASVSALRSLVIVRPQSALSEFEAVLPPGLLGRDPKESAQRAQFWKRFFSAALINVGHVQSKEPTACYYNPLVDAALCTQWRQAAPRRFEILEARLVPGEAIGARELQLDTLQMTPEWTRTNPLGDSLRKIATQRLGALAAANPVKGGGPARADKPSKRDADALQRLAELRLLAQIEGLDATSPDELQATLSQLERKFDASGTADKPAVPWPDSRRFTISAVYSGGSDRRLLVIGLPGKPREYLLVQCRTAGKVCSITATESITL